MNSPDGKKVPLSSSSSSLSVPVLPIPMKEEGDDTEEPYVIPNNKPLRVDQPHIPPPRWFQACFAPNGTLLIMSNIVQGIQSSTITTSTTVLPPSSFLSNSTLPSSSSSSSLPTSTTVLSMNPTNVSSNLPYPHSLTSNTSFSLPVGVQSSLSISATASSSSSSSSAAASSALPTITGLGFGYSFTRSPVSLYSKEATKLLLPYSRNYEELLFRLSLVGRYHQQAIQQQQQHPTSLPSSENDGNRTDKAVMNGRSPFNTPTEETNIPSFSSNVEYKKDKRKQKEVNKKHRHHQQQRPSSSGTNKKNRKEDIQPKNDSLESTKSNRKIGGSSSSERYVSDSEEDQPSIASSISEISAESGYPSEETDHTTSTTSSSVSTEAVSIVPSDETETYTDQHPYPLRRHRRQSSPSLSNNSSFVSSASDSDDLFPSYSPIRQPRGQLPSSGTDDESLLSMSMVSQQPSTVNVNRSNIIHDYSMIASDVHEVTNDLHSLFHIPQPSDYSSSSEIHQRIDMDTMEETNYRNTLNVIMQNDSVSKVSFLPMDTHEKDNKGIMYDNKETVVVYNTDKEVYYTDGTNETLRYPSDNNSNNEGENSMNLVRRPGLGLQKGMVTLALIEGHSDVMEEIHINSPLHTSILGSLLRSCLPYADKRKEKNNNDNIDTIDQHFVGNLIRLIGKQRIAYAHENNYTELENIWNILSLASENIDSNYASFSGSNERSLSFLWNPIVFHSLQYLLHSGYLQDAVVLNEVCKEDYIQHVLLPMKAKGIEKRDNTVDPILLLPGTVSALSELYATELQRQYRTMDAVEIRKGIRKYGNGEKDEYLEPMMGKSMETEGRMEKEGTTVGINDTQLCSLCTLPVKGLFIRCIICGHGGHNDHIREWFRGNNECAEGCGCFCVIG